jgi:hypothetical protein
MSGFTDQQLIGGLVTVLIASYAAFFVWIVASIRELRTELHSRIDRLDEKFTAKIDRLDEKFTAKIEALTIAVSRLEGAVYHAPPERRPAGSDVA